MSRVRRILAAAFLVCLISGKCSSQSESLSVPFIADTAALDKISNRSISSVPWHEFTVVEKSDSGNPAIPARFKIAYSYSHLHLMIEVDSAPIICRDRAYQNGDGFHLVIAKPDGGNSSNEFYVLRFSPPDPSRNRQAGKGVWYYNVALSGNSLGPDTKLVCGSSNGKSCFELLLAWNDVYPYNPAFTDSIGFNLCFVKAIGDKEKNYYFLKYDERLQSELSSREFVSAKFAIPDSVIDVLSLARLEKRNLQPDQPLRLDIASFARSQSNLFFNYKIISDDSQMVGESKSEFAIERGRNDNAIVLPTDHLAAGSYSLEWNSSDGSRGTARFTILPRLDFESDLRSLNALRNGISVGSYYTLEFILMDIFRKFRDVKEYETADGIGEAYVSYRSCISQMESGKDPIERKSGLFRRAFLSKMDSTLQPYSVKIPVDYNPANKYPLFVMLHGSGSDDEDILGGTKLTEGNCIEIAPYGRGTSNCFTTDSAQVDVREVIEDAIRNYSVDTTKIIIAGFSMGGYGAYRIFYEYPRLFCGVAVFSGHPSLATKWIGEGYPDFVKDEYLVPFRNVPVFIYHSKNDMNCPFEMTERLVAKLDSAGAAVRFTTTESGGHEIIDKSCLPAYYEWLNEVLRSR